MHGLDLRLYIQSLCSGLAKELKDRKYSLFEIFRKTTLSIRGPFCFSPLSYQTIKIGRVENTGASCTVSALLQEWAAFPDYFDLFLTSPLQQKKVESDSFFLYRKELQTHLRACVNRLRLGDLVSKNDVFLLVKLLKILGCQKETMTPLQQVLHRCFPRIFKANLPNSYDLYENILALFSDVPIVINQIALFSKSSFLSHRQFIEQSPLIRELDNPILFNLAEDHITQTKPEENFQVRNRIFTLKMVHVCEETAKGKHVVVYRKEGNQWIYCNDTKVCLVNALPLTNIYAVVYDSHT